MTDGLPIAFIDTNVWISGFMSVHGSPGRVLQAFLDERFVPVISIPAMSELRNVISRDVIRARIQFTDAMVETVLTRLTESAISVQPPGTLRICRDPKDDIMLETAISGEAQYVVSGDNDIKDDLNLIAHLHEHNIEVVTVAQFLKLLGEG
jgi:putative PIN family toxin of toxin-antitoxin system